MKNGSEVMQDICRIPAFQTQPGADSLCFVSDFMKEIESSSKSWSYTRIHTTRKKWATFTCLISACVRRLISAWSAWNAEVHRFAKKTKRPDWELIKQCGKRWRCENSVNKGLSTPFTWENNALSKVLKQDLPITRETAWTFSWIIQYSQENV